MFDQKRLETTPEQHIRDMFAETETGKLVITYYSLIEEPYKLSYDVKWDKSDAEELVQKYKKLTSALKEIGEVHNELSSKEQREKLLSADALAVWDIYIKPFEPFEVDLDIIGELYYRGECDQLTDEENELLERHHDWFEAQSLTRLPCVHRSPKYVMNRTQRYEKLVTMKAPQSVIDEEGRCLAEEMVLYYYGLCD